jgi:sporulation protein YlmC with PRC-barrel domain
MDVKYGAKVIDKNGQHLGEVDHIVMDSWSGEPRKFVVRLSDDVSAAYFKPEHVARATEREVSLNVSLEELDKT